MLAGAAALITLGVACGSTAAAPPAPAAAVQKAAATNSPVVYPSKVTILAGEFKYSPNQIDLKAGQAVTLTIVNQGQADHDIKTEMPISGLSYTKADNDEDEQADNASKNVFDVDFNVGTTAVVTFTPTTPGSYVFHCDEPGHTEAGMTGTFVIH
jgi:uncharacterized cupredoxin-like copper-binding protein